MVLLSILLLLLVDTWTYLRRCVVLLSTTSLLLVYISDQCFPSLMLQWVRATSRSRATPRIQPVRVKKARTGLMTALTAWERQEVM